MQLDIQYLRETESLLLGKVELDFKRFLYNEIRFKNRLIGIVGPRGVGKTTLILQYLKEYHSKDEQAIYLSADNVFFKRGDLFEFAREFHLKHGGILICIDEIHRYESWNQELKNIYDSFPDLRIIFSGSSSLNLIKGKYDLSRRGILYSLPGLSFREYLLLEKNIELPSYALEDILKNSFEISRSVSQNKFILKYFNEYLQQGYYPFYKEEQNVNLYYSKILNIVDKAIHEDIASFYNLKTQNLSVFKKILHFLTGITPGEVNINKLAKNLGHNHATIAEYLEILNATNLIRFLPMKKTGHASLKDAKKIFLDNTNLAHALSSYHLGQLSNVGTNRELFALCQLQNAGYTPFFSEQGDIQEGDNLFEIGGKNKHFNQINTTKNSYLVLDDILIGETHKIPLYLLGFLY